MESTSVDVLEAGPLSPELPVGDNCWGDGLTQLLLESTDAYFFGSIDSRGNASEPTDEVEVVFTGNIATEESPLGKFWGDLVED